RVQQIPGGMCRSDARALPPKSIHIDHRRSFMSSRPFGSDAEEQFALSRRQFVQGLAAGGAILGLGLWPKQSWALRSPGQIEVLAGTQFDLSISETLVNYTGKTRPAITINGSVPGPILRWKEGTRVQLRVRNDLPRGSIHGDSTSVHWHGILLPANMDGVPG